VAASAATSTPAAFVRLDDTERQAYVDALRQLLRASTTDVQDALTSFADHGVAPCVDDTVLLLPSPSPALPWVMLRLDEARPLQVHVPHPRHERHTAAEGVALFMQLQARAVLLSNRHRCDSDVPSGCDGSTGVCGPTAPYSESDPAHVVDDVFHDVHMVLADAFADDVVVSLHGMSSAGISLSNGTTASVVDDDALVARLARAFDTRYTDVTVCNALPADDVPLVERLCGTTNAQGRHLNGSADACTLPASTSTGRFLHLEQSLEVRDDVDGVIAAFDEVLPR